MGARLSGLSYLVPKGRGSAPRFPRAAPVAHAVTVGAKTGEVVELGAPGPGDVEGGDVMHFDVALAQASVCAGEVEATDLALQRTSAAHRLPDLPCTELRITLPRQRPPREEASFDSRAARVIYFIRLWGYELQFTRSDAMFDSLSGLEHLGLAPGEGFDHEQCGLAAPSGPAAVPLVVCHEVCGLAADAVWRAETRQGEGFGSVDRQRSKQLRQLLCLKVRSPELTPAVLHDQRSGEQKFILSPRRRPHGQYRMSVRRGGGCVQRTAGRAAHLVRSRCQWGLSPSVMVDCKMSLPLYGCKEGA